MGSKKPEEVLPMCSDSSQGVDVTCEDIAIKLQNVSKCFHIYEKPHHRIFQSLMGEKKTYGKEFWALKDASFEIKKGQTVGIVGGNGAGKSTLLQMICGTLTPTLGEIQVEGRITALLELGAGFNPEFTGQENVYLNAALLGLSKQEIDARYNEILEFADIGEFINQPVKTYSSGMYVRLAFAIQANLDPDVFIVDEALAVGDAYFVQRCMHRFNELKKRGVTILLVTHDANAVKKHCEKAIWIDKGSLRMEGNSTEVVDLYLADLFKRKVIKNNDRSSAKTSSTNSSHKYETNIPNISRRLGDQSCSILGVALYDKKHNEIHSINVESEVVLSFSVINNNIEDKVNVLAGYVFRTSRGEEFASTNTQMEEVFVDMCAIGEILTVNMRIFIPFLHPGVYTFSPTVGFLNERGISILGDRIENAIALDIVSDEVIITPIRMKTEVNIKKVETE